MNKFALQAWADLLQEQNIEWPGLISLFLEQDVIKDQELSIDGSLFEQEISNWLRGYQELSEVSRIIRNYHDFS
jgi:hypothetical protein